MEEKLKQIIDRFNELESLLADPKVISDNVRLKETAKEHTQINLVIPKASRYLVLANEIEENKLLLKSDDEELKSLEGMTNKMLSLLANNNVCTIDDFADLATFDLIDKEEGIFKQLDLDENLVNAMIMKAREKWFKEEKEV